jgi:hypothetical protein
MTTHIRVGAWFDERSGKYDNGHVACGLAELPQGDRCVYEADSYAYHVADCPRCNPGGPKPYGTEVSRLSGRPGLIGFDQFCEITATWGYE